MSVAKLRNASGLGWHRRVPSGVTEADSMWRAARADEDDFIVAMCLAYYSEDPGVAPVSREQIHRTLDVLRREPYRGRALILDLDGSLVGYALLIPFWS